MNTEDSAGLKTGVEQGGRDGPSIERGWKLDRHLRRLSVEILHDLGLSQEKIVAYNLRFPTPTRTARRCERPRRDQFEARWHRHEALLSRR